MFMQVLRLCVTPGQINNNKWQPGWTSWPRKGSPKALPLYGLPEDKPVFKSGKKAAPPDLY